MKDSVKNGDTAVKAPEGQKKRPPMFEQLSQRQIEAIRENRRQGMKEQDIADMMGISLASVSRYSKGIKAREPLRPKGDLPASLPESSTIPNGGEVVREETPKPVSIQVPIELEPELMIILAGAAHNRGYSSLKDYLRDFAVPWLQMIGDASALLEADSPETFKTRLNEIVRDYVTYHRMLEQAQKGVEKNVDKSDRRETIGSQKA